MRKTEWEMDMDEQNTRDRNARAVVYEKVWNPRAFDSSREVVDKAIKFAYEKHRSQEGVASLVNEVTHEEDKEHVCNKECFCYSSRLSSRYIRRYKYYIRGVGRRHRATIFLCPYRTSSGNIEGGYYFPRLKTREGIMIKFADRLNNLSRMESWGEDRKEQYLRKSKFWKS